ncbi:MAG: hypothetical protein EOO69_10560 [Moraxellaceae bacterium]|nr:MAG: hypothetical protein EOO69_10560 [Moraxellaceae bacterium]
MSKENYRIICALFMFSFVCGFWGVMHKLTSYLASGSPVPSLTQIIPFNDHGKMIYITEAQYGNLKIISVILVINLIITGVLAYKADFLHGPDWLDK